MSCEHFALLPRDGLFLKDGRGWYTSDIGRSHSQPWPYPPTLRSALRAAFGRALAEERRTPLDPPTWERESRGVTLRKLVTLLGPLGCDFAHAHRMWPTPADVLYHRADDTGQRIPHYLLPADPSSANGGERPITIGSTEDPAREAQWRPRLPARGKPLPAPDFWPETELRAWLRAEPLTPFPANDAGLAPRRRRDIHLAITPETQAATAGLLFSSEVVETLTADRREWAIALEVDRPTGTPAFAGTPLLLGGRRRIVTTSVLPPTVFAAPVDLPTGAPGLRLLCTTPAEFARGWLPDGFTCTDSAPPVYLGQLPGIDQPVRLCAALVPRPLHLSTWNMVARAPRPTRRLVPPGSVYFFLKQDGSAFTASDFQKLWLAQLGGGADDGLGLVVPGHWNPAATEPA